MIGELLKLDFTIDPTFTIYAASRDLMRARHADWHDEYTLPQLWDYFTPNREHHGSFFFDWGTEDEVAWRANFTRWMAFVNDYKNRGGRVTVGSDSGFIYQIYGFGTINKTAGQASGDALLAKFGELMAEIGRASCRERVSPYV